MDVLTILNTIRENASNEYQTRIPVATQNNITAVGNAILDLDNATEEFLETLIKRIALTVVETKMFNNPLASLKKGGVPLGDSIQEIYINPAKGENFDQTGSNLLNRSLPDVKVLYHRLNRKSDYPVTFSYEGLQQAFTSVGKLNELFTGIINSLYSGDNIDEYILFKNLIADGILTKRLKTANVGDINGTDGAKSLTSDIINASSFFTFPSSSWNSYKDMNPSAVTPVITWTPESDQVLLMRADIMTKINLDVLAVAFNLDKVELLKNIVKVDSFGSASNCYGMLADKSYFKFYDNLKKLESFRNGRGLYWNYFFHHWETISMSYFANAIAFIYSNPTPQLTVGSAASSSTVGKTVISVTPTLTAGNQYMYKLGTNFNLPNIGDICSTDAGFTEWNGTDEITAVTGQKILIVECDANFLAVKAGYTSVTSKTA